jgi:hypothetical protein
MDSSAIYVPALSNVVAESDLRWRLAAYERYTFETDVAPRLKNWAWRDMATGKKLAPAFDESPQLPAMKRWMPTDSKKTWNNVSRKQVGRTERSHFLTSEVGGSYGVMVYQYA